MEEELRKQKKKESNKRYYERKQEELRNLRTFKINDTKNPFEPVEKEKEDFFFLKNSGTQTTTTPQAQSQPPQQIILQQPQTSMKNKILETLMISMIGIIPMAARAIMSRQKPTESSTPSTQEPTINYNVPYTDTNLSF
jgi:hypothetical protein